MTEDSLPGINSLTSNIYSNVAVGLNIDIPSTAFFVNNM